MQYITPNSARDSHDHLWDIQKSDIKEIHRKLLVCIEAVQSLLSGDAQCATRVCLLVLDDDLNALLDEAEDNLFLGRTVNHASFVSFLSRSDTIIQEAVDVISSSSCD